MSEQDPPPQPDLSFPEEPPPPQLPTTEPAGRWRLVAVLIILVIGAAVAVFLLVLKDGGAQPGPAAPSEPQVVATFRGNKDQRTDTFQVESGWEIRWSTRGKRFAIAVSGAEDLGTVVEQRGKQNGSTFPRGVGAFRLDVTARGPWRIEILNHPAREP
jgi:hypothetical protein